MWLSLFFLKLKIITFWFIISPHNKGNKDKLPDALVEGSAMEIRMKGPQFQGTKNQGWLVGNQGYTIRISMNLRNGLCLPNESNCKKNRVLLGKHRYIKALNPFLK